MPISFSQGWQLDSICGADPLVCAVPLDPPVTNKFGSNQTEQADEGVGCGPGGPPYFERKLCDVGKTKGAFRRSEYAT